MRFILRTSTGLIALAISLAAIAPLFTAQAQVAGETKEQRDARMAWWREAKFGMFIHWGLYAVPGGVWKAQPVNTAGEWIMFGGKIPVPEYEPLVQQFNPVKFNADEWVRIAKNAGAKYIVITSKHHDGFCLFDSALTNYDIMSTPFKRDIMKELSDACHKEDIKMCWYHSILDWHHPDYLPRGAGSPRRSGGGIGPASRRAVATGEPCDSGNSTRLGGRRACRCALLGWRYSPPCHRDRSRSPAASPRAWRRRNRSAKASVGCRHRRGGP